MKSLGETFALALFLLLLGGIVAHCTVGCTPGPVAPLPRYCYSEKEFTAALVLCVDKSSTRELAKVCRKKTHEDCGITETVSVVVTHE